MTAENESIKLVLFSTENDEHYHKISKAISELIPKNQIFHCCNINDFSIAVRGILFGLDIVLIVARNKNELNEILQIRQKLKDHSVILILDDSIDDLTHSALQLYPRYTSYIKNEYSDIFLVLKKMITKIQNNIKGGQNGRDY
jgi:hypothetical protein